MTEEEWANSDNPVSMLAAVAKHASDRKLRLFAVACCRHFSSVMSDEPFFETVQTAEKFADDASTKAALKRSRQAVRAVRHAMTSAVDSEKERWAALSIAEVTASENAFAKMAEEIPRLCNEGLIAPSRRPPMEDYFRCIFGNPFRQSHSRPMAAKPSVKRLAKDIYEAGSFDRVVELGTALQGSGCQDSAIPKHCLAELSHVRGCWVVDMLLKKE